MTHPLFALQSAITARLKTDAPLLALLGGAKCYEHAPPATVHPWIAWEQLSARDADTSLSDGHEHRLSLICASRQPGTKEVLTIAARVEELLHGASLTLVGHRLINLVVTAAEIQRAGKEPLRKARISLRAVTEKL